MGIISTIRTTWLRPLGCFPRAACIWLICLSAALGPPGVGAEEEMREHPLEVEAAAIPTPLRQPIVGERLGFHGRWFGIPVGSGWIEVKELVALDGRQAYHIEAQGHSNQLLSAFYPIHDVVHSYLDAETLKPLRFEKQQSEGHYRADEVVTFDHAASKAFYRSRLNESTKEIELPAEFQDLISALYWLRAQPVQPRQTISLNIYTDEKIYQTDIQVKELLLLELLKRGTFACLVVEPKAAFKGLLVRRGRIWAYLTADPHRLPLLVKATTPWGAMTAVLDEESIPAAVKRDAGRGAPSP